MPSARTNFTATTLFTSARVSRGCRAISRVTIVSKQSLTIRTSQKTTLNANSILPNPDHPSRPGSDSIKTNEITRQTISANPRTAKFDAIFHAPSR